MFQIWLLMLLDYKGSESIRSQKLKQIMCWDSYLYNLSISAYNVFQFWGPYKEPKIETHYVLRFWSVQSQYISVKCVSILGSLYVIRTPKYFQILCKLKALIEIVLITMSVLQYFSILCNLKALRPQNWNTSCAEILRL